MGIHAAHCMTDKAADTGTSFAFELFTHATHFMGQKVILLGLYNGQGLDEEPESDMTTYSRALEVCLSSWLHLGKHSNKMSHAFHTGIASRALPCVLEHHHLLHWVLHHRAIGMCRETTLPLSGCFF